jgi:cbb3-type cytochrome oxidase subunit 1
VAMAVHPAWAVYRTAHLHMNLLGFVAMMIFGVAYHVIPRFTGHSLHSRRLAAVHGGSRMAASPRSSQGS